MLLKLITENKYLIINETQFIVYEPHQYLRWKHKIIESSRMLLLAVESDSIIHLNSEECLHCSREQWCMSLLFRSNRVQSKSKCIEPGPTQQKKKIIFHF